MTRTTVCATVCALILSVAGCANSEEDARELYYQALALVRDGETAEATAMLEHVVEGFPQTRTTTDAIRVLAQLALETIAQNEETAVMVLREINTQQVTFMASHQGNYAETLSELVDAGYTNSEYLVGTQGYTYEVRGDRPNSSYSTFATPDDPAGMYFRSSPEGLVRFEVRRPATAESPTVR